MNCPGPGFLAIFLEISTFILMLLIVIGVIYFLLRKFNKLIKFTAFLRVILLYYICVVILYSISEIFVFSFYLKFVKFLIFTAVLFAVFYLITRKVLLIDWKKSLAIFLLMSFILLPILDLFRMQIEFKISLLPSFQKQEKQMGAEDIQNMIYCAISPPLYMKIMGDIESGIASWPRSYLLDILINWPKGY